MTTGLNHHMHALPDPTSTPTAADDGLLAGGWYTTEELAVILRLDPSSLRRWRTGCPVQGPPFVPISDRVTLYSARDVEEWLRNRRIDPRKAA